MEIIHRILCLELEDWNPAQMAKTPGGLAPGGAVYGEDVVEMMVNLKQRHITQRDAEIAKAPHRADAENADEAHSEVSFYTHK